MNYEEAVNWCKKNPLKVVENMENIMYYDDTYNTETYHECDCDYCEGHYETVGMILINLINIKSKFTKSNDYNIVYEIDIKSKSLKTIDINRYNWITKRGYEKEPHKYVLTTLYPYSGYLYVDDEPICPAWLTEENDLYFNDYGKNALKSRNLIGKSLIIKNISDTITGYKCRYPSIIGKEDEWVIDVGEMRGSSSCAVCLFDPKDKCVKPD